MLQGTVERSGDCIEARAGTPVDPYDIYGTGQARRAVKLPDYSQLPQEGLARIAQRFMKGEVVYGRDNWKKGGADYELDAFNHAMEHLLNYAAKRWGGKPDDGDDDLAAIGWWVVTTCWFESKR